MLGADLISLMAVCWWLLSRGSLAIDDSVSSLTAPLLFFQTPTGNSNFAVAGRGER